MPTNTAQTGAPLSGLSSALSGILQQYLPAQTTDPSSKEHSVALHFRQAEEALGTSLLMLSRPDLEVAHYIGVVNWATVPSIVLRDKRETTTAQRGRYIAFLFRADCSGVYLTLLQRLTESQKKLGRAKTRAQLHRRAVQLRKAVPELVDRGFLLDDTIELGEKWPAADYAASTIAHKFYPAEAMPADHDLQADLELLLTAYARVIQRPGSAAVGARAWIFQGNPSLSDVAGMVRALPELTWTVNQHAAAIHVGDTVYIWESGRQAGIVALAEVISAVTTQGDNPESARFRRKPEQFAEPKPRARLRILRVLDEKLSKRQLVQDPRLAKLSILRAPKGTNFPLTAAQQQAIDSLLPPSLPPLGPAELCAAFAAALRASSLSFGTQHDTVIRNFLASVLAKPFVILTGLSGSGKTQLALKLGEWLGDGQYRVIAVRPDWTGPESLLGYEDALLPVIHGQRAWHVPEALELILTAARHPQSPYLLILDEMNLAHVERYFADVLSGIESRESVLPNLEQDSDGLWRIPLGQPAKKPLPRNLIIIGTVNVDETTYMFSPKVLDRANTIEFRVATDALPSDPAAVVRPARCAAASGIERSSLFRIVTDDSWQKTQATPALATFAEKVRAVHARLANHGCEFGHRTYYESLRLAALLIACGVASTDESVDVFVLQKVLPRLHGARRKLEPLLRALGAFAVDPQSIPSSASDFDVLSVSATEKPALPYTFAKIVRMVRALHANQYASFSD